MVVDLDQASSVSFDIDRPLIEAPALWEPDPNWVFIDAAGHEHRWWHGRVTTVRVIEDMPGDDEYPAVTHRECILCGERIEPGYRTPAYMQYIVGVTRRIVHAEFQIQRAQQLYQDLLAALQDSLSVTLRFGELLSAEARVTSLNVQDFTVHADFTVSQ